MFKSIKEFIFGKVENHQPKRKPRIRHHALVVGDNVGVTWITGNNHGCMEVKYRVGTVVKVHDSLNFEILTSYGYTMKITVTKHRITLLDQTLVEGDSVEYTLKASLARPDPETVRWYKATIEKVNKDSYLVKTEKGYFYERSIKNHVFRRIL